MNKRWWLVLGAVVLVIVIVLLVVFLPKKTKQNSSTTSGNPTTDTTDSAAIAAGKQLSNNHCSGTGTVPLIYAPMKPDQISFIDPYGLTVGGHVTPVDHEYYWAKNNVKDANDVLALADGRMVDIEYRSHNGQGAIPGDYRVVISYTCTFMSYFDLATSLAPDIAAQLPSGWESSGHTDINIPVKAGQIIAKMGGQSLDFAVWDMTKNNPKLLVPAAYTAEAWKIHTVAPLDYFTSAVTDQILPFYARQAQPRDGYYAYDVDGKLIGSWFLQGTGGYSGANSSAGLSGNGYWGGHLAIVPDFLDPTVLGFSIGDYQGTATQFVVQPPATDPATIGVDTGLVKYQLLHIQQYVDATGKTWNGLSTPTGALKMPTTGVPTATALLQLTGPETLKVELFPGKTPAQVSVFDSNAKIYTRSGL